jgi:hypothetical protein
MRDRVLDFEILRLMQAFEKIRDPHARRAIIKVVEAAAKGAVFKRGGSETTTH